MFINKVLKNIKYINTCILSIKQIDCLCALASLREIFVDIKEGFRKKITFGAVEPCRVLFNKKSLYISRLCIQ